MILPRGDVPMVSSNVTVSTVYNHSSTHKITVYTMPTCNKCVVLKEWLKNVKTDFEELDLENVNVMAELVMKDVVVLSAPIIDVDGIVYMENQIFEGNSLAIETLKKILGGKANE
jgi:glutaredoxin